jgi:hypothetical protein
MAAPNKYTHDPTRSISFFSFPFHSLPFFVFSWNSVFIDFSYSTWVQVIEMESLFLNPDHDRVDLAHLLRDIQTQEKQKLHLVHARANLWFLSLVSLWELWIETCNYVFFSYWFWSMSKSVVLSVAESIVFNLVLGRFYFFVFFHNTHLCH